MPFSVTSSGIRPPVRSQAYRQAGLEALRPELVAHVEHRHAVLGAEDAVGADAQPRVGLHAEEVVAVGGVEEHVLQLRRRRSTRSSPPSTATYSVIDRVSPTGTPGAADRIASTALRWASTKTSLTRRRRSRSCLPGGKTPNSHPIRPTTLGSLSVQARRDHVAQLAGEALAERGEPVGGDGVLPAAPLGDPPGVREVVERHGRLDAVAAQRLALAAVVVDGRVRTTRPPRARCGSTRPRSGSCRGRGRRPGRRPRPSGSTSRRRRPTVRRTVCGRRAPTPTSRCSSSRPRSGGRRWRCPTGTRRGSGAAVVSSVTAGKLVRGPGAFVATFPPCRRTPSMPS